MCEDNVNNFSIIGIVDDTNSNPIVSKMGNSIRVVSVMNREKIVSCDLFVDCVPINIIGFKSRNMYKFWFDGIVDHTITDLPGNVQWIPWKERVVPSEGTVTPKDFKVIFEPFFINESQKTFGIGINYGEIFHEEGGYVNFGYKEGSNIFLLNEYAEMGDPITLKGVNLGVYQEQFGSMSKILSVSTINEVDPFKEAEKFTNNSFVKEVYQSLEENRDKYGPGYFVTITAWKIFPGKYVYTPFGSEFTIAVVRQLFIDK